MATCIHSVGGYVDPGWVRHGLADQADGRDLALTPGHPPHRGSAEWRARQRDVLAVDLEALAIAGGAGDVEPGEARDGHVGVGAGGEGRHDGHEDEPRWESLGVVPRLRGHLVLAVAEILQIL